MAESLPRVMISSTFIDLEAHRAAVRDACMRLGYFPIMMEYLPASDEPAREVSLDMTGQADVFIGIYAQRYGHIPESHDKSITELELERAENDGIPILVFISDDEHQFKPVHFETGDLPRAKLTALKERACKGRVRQTFKSADHLQALVAQSLVNIRPVRSTDTAAATTVGARPAAPLVDPERPTLWRRLLDRWCPRLHGLLTGCGVFREPKDRATVASFLEVSKAALQEELSRSRKIIPVEALEPATKNVPRPSLRDPVLGPVPQLIRELVGIASDELDGANAEIAAYSKRSRSVRNVFRRLLSAREPLILLGEPGAGKSLQLRQVAHDLALRGLRQQYPVVCVLARLGEFFVDESRGEISIDHVWEFVERTARQQGLAVSPRRLHEQQRLAVIFDGMDEMSRRRYRDHVEALSKFATSVAGSTRTLFSCRIADFPPSFRHRRLVLLPFGRPQILEFIRSEEMLFPLTIDGVAWTDRRLATHLSEEDLPVEPTNPFVLAMVCAYLRESGRWPDSRVQLLDFVAWKLYSAKCPGLREEQFAADLECWSRLALAITRTNRGTAFELEAARLTAGDPSGESIDRAKACGIIIQSVDEVSGRHYVRFDHHRWQEHFAGRSFLARTFSEEGIEIDAVLDSERWRETLINLAVTPVDAGKAVEVNQRTLNERIEAALERLPRESLERDPFRDRRRDRKFAISYTEERAAADRVEFVSRTLAASSLQSMATRNERVVRLFTDSLHHLARSGRPTTQVKMLDAARRVRGMDIGEVAEIVTQNADTQWAHDHAVSAVTASGVRHAHHIGQQVVNAYADGSLLFQLRRYLRMARGLKRKDPLMVGRVALGGVLAFAHGASVIVLLAIAAIAGANLVEAELEAGPDPVVASIFATDSPRQAGREEVDRRKEVDPKDGEKLAAKLSEWSKLLALSRTLSSPLCMAAAAAAMLIVLMLQFRARARMESAESFPLWASLAGSFVGVLGVIVLWRLNFSDLPVTPGPQVVLLFHAALLLLALGVAAALLDFLGLLLLNLGINSRSPSPLLSNGALQMLRSRGYVALLGFVGFILGMGLIGVAIGAALSLSYWLAEVLSWNMAVVFVLVIGVLFVVAAVVAGVFQQWRSGGSLWDSIRGRGLAILGAGLVLALQGGIGFGAIWVLQRLLHSGATFWDYVIRAVVVIVTMIGLGLSLVALYWLLRPALKLARVPSPQSRGEVLRQLPLLSAEQQNTLLRNLDPARLEIKTTSEWHSLLVEALDLVPEDPARSTLSQMLDEAESQRRQEIG